MALGVLLGYPFGGILYAFLGKSAPFVIIACLTLATLGLQVIFLDMKRTKSEVSMAIMTHETRSSTASSFQVCVKNTNYSSFLADAVVLKILGAIFVSTIAMAILEPCLPIWLMATLKPEVSLTKPPEPGSE